MAVWRERKRPKPALGSGVRTVFTLDISAAPLGELAPRIVATRAPQISSNRRQPLSRATRASAQFLPFDEPVGIVGERQGGHATRPPLEHDVCHTLVLGCTDDRDCALHELHQLRSRTGI